MSASGGAAAAAAAAAAATAAPHPPAATAAAANTNAATAPASALYADASRRDLAPGAHRRKVLSVSWGPSGRRLASAGADGAVRLWTLDPRASSRGERPDAELRGSNEPVAAVAFSLGRDDLLASCGGRCVRFWDARSQRSVATVPLPASAAGEAGAAAASAAGASATATHLSWSPDGSQVAVALCGRGAAAAGASRPGQQAQQQQGSVALVDARRFRVARSFSLRSPAGGLAFALPQQHNQHNQPHQQQQGGSANGGAAAAAAATAAGGGGSAAGAAAGETGTNAATTGSAATTAADRLLVGSAWGDLDALTLTGELIGSARGHCDATLCLAQSPAGGGENGGGGGGGCGLVATGGNDGVVTVFDARAGTPLAALSMFDAPVRAVSLSADGRLVAAGGQPGALEICAIDDRGGKPALLHSIPLQHRSQGGGGGCEAVAFNPRFAGVLAFGDEARDGSGVVSVVVLSRGAGGGGGGGGGGMGAGMATTAAITATAPLRALGVGGGSGGGAAGGHHNHASSSHHHHRPPSSGGGGMGGRPLPPAYPSTAVRGGGGGW